MGYVIQRTNELGKKIYISSPLSKRTDNVEFAASIETLEEANTIADWANKSFHEGKQEFVVKTYADAKAGK
jgi:hypothetical protein